MRPQPRPRHRRPPRPDRRRLRISQTPLTAKPDQPVAPQKRGDHSSDGGRECVSPFTTLPRNGTTVVFWRKRDKGPLPASDKVQGFAAMGSDAVWLYGRGGQGFQGACPVAVRSSREEASADRGSPGGQATSMGAAHRVSAGRGPSRCCPRSASVLYDSVRPRGTRVTCERDELPPLEADEQGVERPQLERRRRRSETSTDFVCERPNRVRCAPI